MELRYAEAESGIERQGGPSSSKQGQAQRNAVQAYRDMLNLDDERVVLCHAHQVMTHPVTTVNPGMGVQEVWSLFQEKHIHQAPVVNGQKRMIGMLFESDLLRFLIVDGGQVRYLNGKKVQQAMSAQVITADPISDIHRIARVMSDEHINGVPVVNEQKELVGLVTRGDILRRFANDPPLKIWT